MGCSTDALAPTPPGHVRSVGAMQRAPALSRLSPKADRLACTMSFSPNLHLRPCRRTPMAVPDERSRSAWPRTSNGVAPAAGPPAGVMCETATYRMS